MVEDPYAETGGDDENADVTALTGVVNVYFPRMRDWMKEYIMEAAERVRVRCSWAFHRPRAPEAVDNIT